MPGTTGGFWNRSSVCVIWGTPSSSWSTTARQSKRPTILWISAPVRAYWGAASWRPPGSGKSSLIAETLYPALAARLHGSLEKPGAFRKIDGLDYFDKVIDITQDPIGRTPRSNPATRSEERR